MKGYILGVEGYKNVEVWNDKITEKEDLNSTLKEFELYLTPCTHYP